jgi:hypothetical protein
MRGVVNAVVVFTPFLIQITVVNARVMILVTNNVATSFYPYIERICE